MQQTGHHRDGDGAIANRDQDGDDGRALLDQGRVAWVVDAHGLEHAPQAMVQVHAQQDHRHDVKRRDRVVLEAGDDVVVDVRRHGVPIDVLQGEYGPNGEVQDVKDDEGADDGAAPDHGAGGVGSRHVILLDVGDGPGGPILAPKLDGGGNVQNYGRQQESADRPQRDGVGGVVEEAGVAIDLPGIGRIDLEVAEQVSDYVAEENHAGKGHDGLLADRGFVKADGPADGIDRDCTHTVILLGANWLRRNGLVTPVPRGARSGAKAIKLSV